MGEPARGMERTSTFAGMWRAEASRRGGCWESRAMDRRGQASAAVNCSRRWSGDRAENGCAMVPVGSGAREGPTHGVPGGGRFVDGCGRQSWCVMRVGGGLVGAGCPELGSGGRWRVVVVGVSCYRCPTTRKCMMRVKTARGLRPESLGRGNGALAAGYPRLGWPGCPGAPWGWRLPTSAGCETTACFSVTEVLRFRP